MVTHCSFVVKLWFLSCCCSGVVSDVQVCKTDARKAMEVVCKFVYFEVIISTCISILTEAVTWRFSVKKMFLEIVQISQENKIIPWLTLHTWKTVCVSWLTNFCKGMCLFKSWLIHGLLVLLFYDIKKFTNVLLRS